MATANADITPTPTPPLAKGKLSEAETQALAIKTILLHLLETDTDLRHAIRTLALPERSEAELMANVQDVVERIVRPDALRRPGLRISA